MSLGRLRLEGQRMGKCLVRQSYVVFWQATPVFVAGTLVASVKAVVWIVTHQTPNGWASATVAEQWRNVPAAGPLEYTYGSLNLQAPEFSLNISTPCI
jgi:hypothetical protein